MNNAFRDKSKDHKSKHYWFRYLLGQGLNNHNLISLSQYPREISQATMMTGSSRWQSAVIGGNGAWRARMRTMNPKSNRTCLYRRSDRGPVLLVWAADCELSLALVHARRPAWPGETSETMLRVAPPRKTRPPDHTRVNWPVDASASGSAQVGPGGRHRWAARVQVGQEPARQKAREGYPSHYTSLVIFIRFGVQCVRKYMLYTTLIPTWVSNHMPNKVRDEITYLFPNVNSCTMGLHV